MATTGLDEALGLVAAAADAFMAQGMDADLVAARRLVEVQGLLEEAGASTVPDAPDLGSVGSVGDGRVVGLLSRAVEVLDGVGPAGLPPVTVTAVLPARAELAAVLSRLTAPALGSASVGSSAASGLSGSVG